ncbi:hypothetical protein C1645_818713 [Glomus cerebriforme]|uniref:Uncharacterized protein n=1 Tax=Glomus cerebriforme TaxID=658196 RepID=A0A397T6K3_9GLOM|nr:hypothetical protein C1645_818713 [Glomus cerebriforme]
MFDEEVLLGKRFKIGDEKLINWISKRNKFLRDFYKFDKMMLRFYIEREVKDEKKIVVVDYDSTKPRVAHYIRNIQYRDDCLFIKVNDQNEKYLMDEIKRDTLVQTPILLDGIILIMIFLDDEENSPTSDMSEISNKIAY